MTERVTEERGNEAYAVAMELFQKNHGKMSDAQLQERIIETLRMLKFDHGNGYYFILKLDGTLLLTGAGTQMEGKNLLTDASAEQQAGVRSIIEFIKLNTQGHFEYSWNKPNSTDAYHPKISYFRLLMIVMFSDSA